MKFKKLLRWKVLHKHGLQILKVSCDLETLVYIVVEIPWIYPTIDLRSNLNIKNKIRLVVETNVFIVLTKT